MLSVAFEDFILSRETEFCTIEVILSQLTIKEAP